MSARCRVQINTQMPCSIRKRTVETIGESFNVNNGTGHLHAHQTGNRFEWHDQKTMAHLYTYKDKVTSSYTHYTNTKT